MTVTETQIPIVDVTVESQQQQQQPVPKSFIVGTIVQFVHNHTNTTPRNFQQRALSLVDGSADDHHTPIHQQLYPLLQQQTDAVTIALDTSIATTPINITVEDYNAFCTRMNEHIRMYDLLAANIQVNPDNEHRERKIVTALIALTSFLGVYLLYSAVSSLSSSLSSSDILYFILTWTLAWMGFLFIMTGILIQFHKRIHQHALVANRVGQTKAYQCMERECHAFAKDISTSSIVTTLHLGYTPCSINDRRTIFYIHPITKSYVSIMKFDHIIVTSTTIDPSHYTTNALTPVEVAVDDSELV